MNKERAEFEAWYGSKPEFGNFIYTSQLVQARWEAWQAARAAPTAPPTDAEIMAVQYSVNTVLNYTPERVVKLVIEAFLKMRE